MLMSGLTLKTRLFGLTGGLIIVLILAAAVSAWHLNKLERQTELLAKTKLPLLNHLFNLQQIQTDIHASLTLMYIQPDSSLQEVIERQQVRQQTLLGQIDVLLKTTLRESLHLAQQQTIEDLQVRLMQLNQQQINYEDSVIALVTAMKANGVLPDGSQQKLLAQLNNLQTLAREFALQLERYSQQQVSTQKYLLHSLSIYLTFLFSVGIVLGLLFSIRLYHYFRRRLGTEPELLQNIAQHLLTAESQGLSKQPNLHDQLLQLRTTLTHFTIHLQQLAQGEIGAISHDQVEQSHLHSALTRIMQRLNAIKALSKAAANGDYSQRLSAYNEQDSLAQAVNQMLRQVQQVTEQSRRSDWLKTGQTELNECMRGEQLPIALMQKVLNFLANYLQAQVGVFYLQESDQFRLVCSYAYQIRNNNSITFHMGEGLIGQAALEQKTLIFNHLPANQQFLSINSGMGETSPTALCMLPLVYEGEVLGVLAFGSQYECQQTQLELLERVANNIAITLKSSLSQLEMRALLEQSQKLAEELQSQQSEIMSREARIHAIVDTVIDAIITIDEHGIVESFNKAAETIFGYREQEVIGQNIKMLMPEPYHSEHDGYLSRYFKDGNPRIIGNPREVSGRRKDGTCFPIDLAVNEMWLGSHRLFTGIVRDITERKRAEAALKANQLELQEREARIRAIVDTVVDAIITIDEHGNIESFNKAAQQLFGYASYEVIGEAINMLMPAPYCDEHDGYLKRYLKTGEARIIGMPRELKARRKNGDVFPIDLAISEMYLGEHRLFTGIIRDITERKQAEEELRVRQEELQTQNEEMQAQNEELQAQQEELQSQQDELRKTNEVLEARTYELEQQKVEVNSQNIILQQHRNEIELKAQELAQASQYKSEFLANMSHELRTPLNSLLILAQLLSENREKNLTEKQVDYARTIHSSGTDLLTLINEILDLSKIEAGHVEIYREDVPLDALFSSLQWKFQPIAETRQLKFRQVIADNTPNTIYTDEQRLKQVLNNLLSNAFKFTSQGEVCLHASTVINPHGLAQGHWLLLQVIDTGIGIPEDKQTIIFEAFRQGDGTTSRRYGGTGLGLSISRQLAHVLGGTLQLTSHPDHGSTFSLFLPLEMNKDTPVPEPLPAIGRSEKIPEISIIPSEPKPIHTSNIEDTVELEARQLPGLPAGERRFAPAPVPFLMFTPPAATLPDDRDLIESGDLILLIIDDDRKFLDLLKELANEHHFKCLLAEDGMTGLLLAEEYRPSAIILDVNLPRINGWGVMESLKDGANTRHIPVCFVSGTEESHLARELGAIGYLVKPANLEHLHQTLTFIKSFSRRQNKILTLLIREEARYQAIISMIDNQLLEIVRVGSETELIQFIQSHAIDCLVLDAVYPTLLEHLKKRQENTTAAPTQLPYLPILIYTESDLSPADQKNLGRFYQMTIKTVDSLEQLLDQVMLFLHQVETVLPLEKQRILRLAHDREALLANKKVLIVDDDVRNTFALTTFLEGREMEVLVAENGREGLNLLEQYPDIAIVLMDIMMPEMDGYEATREIRTQVRFRTLPIIALTAKAMKGDRSKCIEAGASDYLTKPVDTDRLISLMRVWLYQ